MIIIPQYIDFKTWANNLFIDLPDLNIPIADSEENWKGWALRLIEENTLNSVPLPNTFSNWKLWADYFVNNV